MKIVPLRRHLLRELDVLLDLVEQANVDGGALPEHVAALMREVGIKRPESLTPYGRVLAVWAKQEPLMNRGAVEFFGSCTFQACKSPGFFDGRCTLHMVRRRPA